MSLDCLKTSCDVIVKWLSQHGLHPGYLSGAGVAGVILIYYLSRQKKTYNLPPGPWQWPLIGNAIELSRSEKLAPANFYDMYKHRYGPVFMIKILGREIVVLNNLDVIREATTERPNDFANRPEIYTGNFLSDNGKDILFGQYGPEWKYHRQIVHQAMRKYASGEKLQRIIENATTMATGEMLRLAQDGPFDLRATMLLMTFNFVAGICFGKEYKLDDVEFQKIHTTMKEFTETFGSGSPVDFLPWLAYVPFFWPGMRRMEKFMKSFKEFIHDEIMQHRSTLSTDGEPRDLTDYVLLLQAEAEAEAETGLGKHRLTEQHFVNTISNIFGAGIDTMTTTVQWLAIMMAKYPNIQRKMQNEIDTALTKATSLNDMRPFLQYTEAVICEVMRLETMAPLGVPLATSCDTRVGGYDVRKGTMVLLNIWALHHSPDYWDDPEEFRPERFLDPEGHLVRRPAAFIPFSLGRRQCVGEAVAKVALLGFAVNLVSRVGFHVPSEEDFKISRFKISVGNIPANTPLLVKSRHV